MRREAETLRAVSAGVRMALVIGALLIGYAVDGTAGALACFGAYFMGGLAHAVYRHFEDEARKLDCA